MTTFGIVVEAQKHICNSHLPAQQQFLSVVLVVWTLIYIYLYSIATHTNLATHVIHPCFKVFSNTAVHQTLQCS